MLHLAVPFNSYKWCCTLGLILWYMVVDFYLALPSMWHEQVLPFEVVLLELSAALMEVVQNDNLAGSSFPGLIFPTLSFSVDFPSHVRCQLCFPLLSFLQNRLCPTFQIQRLVVAESWCPYRMEEKGKDSALQFKVFIAMVWFSFNYLLQILCWHLTTIAYCLQEFLPEFRSIRVCIAGNTSSIFLAYGFSGKSFHSQLLALWLS